MSTLFKDSEKHQCFMARCTVSHFLLSVRCGLQGSVIVKNYLDRCMLDYFTHYMCHKESKLSSTEKKSSAHSL